MNYKLKLISGAELTISEELYNKIISMPEIKGVIRSSELGGAINLSCMEYMLPEKQALLANANNSKAKKEKLLHDGSKAVLKNGSWVDSYSGKLLDYGYYPELSKDIDLEEVKMLK